MKWFSLSHPCNKLTLCFRTNYAKAEPLEGGTASLFQLCVASDSLSVPVCEICLLQLLFIKKLNALPFLWDRLGKKKIPLPEILLHTVSMWPLSICLLSFFFSSEKPILSTSHLLRQLLECSVYLCVNTCFLVQSALSSALYKNSLSYLQITLWRNCQFGKREYREAERLDCWAGTDRSAFFFSSLLSFSVLLPLYMSVLVITEPQMCLSAPVYDIEMVSDHSKHFSQYSQGPSCHFSLRKESFSLLTFLLRKPSLKNWPGFGSFFVHWCF